MSVNIDNIAHRIYDKASGAITKSDDQIHLRFLFIGNL
jgi:hypothetical protein